MRVADRPRRAGQLESTRVLLDKGAACNAKNKYGYTALTLAASTALVNGSV